MGGGSCQETPDVSDDKRVQGVNKAPLQLLSITSVFFLPHEYGRIWLMAD